jgi:predicted  nucleic acid-binding Zn-ribbon protein
MNKIYLTEEEKKEITDIQSQENDYMVQFGQIEYQIQSLKLQKSTIEQDLIKFDQRKTKFAQQLQDNYGEGSINIETGEFIKSN